jgi:hypothetical protein
MGVAVRISMLVCALWLASSNGSARAQEQAPEELAVPFSAHPYAREVRVHYYERLARSPAKALAWDLLLPGAGSLYTGLYVNTIVAASVSLLGASLWVAGAAKDHDALWWSGMATFGAGRAYGVVSAPVGARLLNAAYRRHFGL